VWREGTRSEEMVDAEAGPGHSAGLGLSQEVSTCGSKLNGPPKPRTSIPLDFRQEPGAEKPHAGICGGGAGQPAPLPDHFQFLSTINRTSVVEHGEFCTAAAVPAPFAQERESHSTARPDLRPAAAQV
jgi:hypothetical protein